MSTELKDTLGTDFLVIGLPVIIVFGCVGNFLAYLVYSRKFFKKTQFSLYLKTLCVTDSIAIVVYICSALTRGWGVNVKNASTFSCKFIWYLYYVPTACSSWIEAIVCFDRMVNILAPTKCNFIKQKRFVYSAIAVVFLYNLALYVPTLVFFEGPELDSDWSNRTKCDADESFILGLSWADFINSTAVPFLVMLVSTILTVRKLNQSRKSTFMIRSSNESLNTLQSAKKREQKDLHYAVTSISLCILFFVLNFGISSYYLISNYIKLSYVDDKLFYGVCICLFTSDYSIKFYIYMLVNNHFYKEFKTMLKELAPSSIQKLKFRSKK